MLICFEYYFEVLKKTFDNRKVQFCRFDDYDIISNGSAFEKLYGTVEEYEASIHIS